MLLNVNVDEARLIRRYAILECIFYKSDKQHRRKHGRIIVDAMRELDACTLIEPQPLQLDILADISNFLTERDEVLACIVVDILCEVDETLESSDCESGISDKQAVDGIEGIEKEVRIDLRLEKGKFGFVALKLQFLTCETLAVGFGTHSYNKAESDNENEVQPHSLAVLPHSPVRQWIELEVQLAKFIVGRCDFVA